MRAIDRSRLFHPTRYDYLLTAAILGVFLWMLVPLSRSLTGGPGKALVYDNGRLVQEVDLSHDGTLRVHNGSMTLQVQRRRIRVLRSDCPHKICERAGWISSSGQTIACAPNKVLIEIVGESAVPGYAAVSH